MNKTKNRKNANPFANVATDGINNGDRKSAAEFREMMQQAEKISVTKNGTTNKAGGTRKKKKKKKKTREEVIFEVRHNVGRWDALYRGEIARLEANPNLISRDREYYYQVKVMLYVAENYPELQYLAHASPNGGARSGFEAFRLGCAGLSKGHPDLQFLYPSSGYHGLFIEMKKEIGDYRKEAVALSEVSYYQHLHRIKFQQTGYLSVVCYGYEEAIATIDAYMKGTPCLSRLSQDGATMTGKT